MGEAVEWESSDMSCPEDMPVGCPVCRLTLNPADPDAHRAHAYECYLEASNGGSTK